MVVFKTLLSVNNETLMFLTLLNSVKYLELVFKDEFVDLSLLLVPLLATVDISSR